MGFSEGCITQFQSTTYLSERIFFVSIENQVSDYGRMLCSVPQGSYFSQGLGPLLFLIYVIMPQAVKSNLFLYVDSLCVMF